MEAELVEAFDAVAPHLCRGDAKDVPAIEKPRTAFLGKPHLGP